MQGDDESLRMTAGMLQEQAHRIHDSIEELVAKRVGTPSEAADLTRALILVERAMALVSSLEPMAAKDRLGNEMTASLHETKGVLLSARNTLLRVLT
jgi:hypothetical protein